MAVWYTVCGAVGCAGFYLVDGWTSANNGAGLTRLNVDVRKPVFGHGNTNQTHGG